MDEREIRFEANGRELDATLGVPSDARGLVIFAHGSGSGRLSPRNRYVASTLNESGIATLLLDLLTPEEERIDEQTAQLRFDVSLLAERMVAATKWAAEQRELASLVMGYFGASTGAAAALIAAAQFRDVRAVVSRGGRPDLAGEALDRVTSPVLLIVGERDPVVLDMNQSAAGRLKSSELVIVPGATHLFQERGALETVAELAQNWFVRHLQASAA